MFDFVTANIPKETLAIKGITPKHVEAFFDGLELILGPEVANAIPEVGILTQSVVDHVCEENALDLLYMSNRTKYVFWAFVFTTIASFIYWSDGEYRVPNFFWDRFKTRLKCKNFYLPDHTGFGYGANLGYRSISDYSRFLKLARMPSITELGISVFSGGRLISNRGLTAVIDQSRDFEATVSFYAINYGKRVKLAGLKTNIHELVNGIIDEVVLYGVIDSDGKETKRFGGSWNNLDYEVKIKNA